MSTQASALQKIWMNVSEKKSEDDRSGQTNPSALLH